MCASNLIGICILGFSSEVLNMNQSFMDNNLYSIEYYVNLILLFLCCLWSSYMVVRHIKECLTKPCRNVSLWDTMLLVQLFSCLTQFLIQLVVTWKQGSLIDANTTAHFLCFYTLFPACFPILLWLLEILSVRLDMHKAQVRLVIFPF